MMRRTREIDQESIERLASESDRDSETTLEPELELAMQTRANQARHAAVERHEQIEDQAEVIGRAIRKAGGGRQSNVEGPGISAFNPQGDREYPRPELRFKKVFLPFPAEPDLLTWEELELLNLVRQGRYTIRLTDDTMLAIDAIVKINDVTGETEELHLRHETAFNREHYRAMPALRLMLRQILDQHPETKDEATKVQTIQERRAQVARGELPVSVGA